MVLVTVHAAVIIRFLLCQDRLLSTIIYITGSLAQAHCQLQALKTFVMNVHCATISNNNSNNAIAAIEIQAVLSFCDNNKIPEMEVCRFESMQGCHSTVPFIAFFKDLAVAK